ncbi:MAG: acyltransferase [Acutalibacteraceae bacterium]|nr:acyltransferase [Acutalibacteraceae bacterium]
MQSSETISVKGTRNYGIDLLRIVSMLMVVLLHILGQGGILKSTVPITANYEVSWFLEIAALCAVNCYALISGYVGYGSKFKYTNIVYIWIQVVFYNFFITLIYSFILPNVTSERLWGAIFPVTNRAYWYFTAYFCIYFLTPIINTAIKHLTENKLKAISLSLILIFTVIPLFAKADLFFTVDGYSAFWLVILYFLGGVIKKCRILEKIRIRWLLLMYLGVILITWLHKLWADCHNMFSPNEPRMKQIFVEYTSPTILFAAIFLLVAFSKLKMNKRAIKFIKWSAPLSFGVYLIHVQGYIWRQLFKNAFAYYAEFNWIALVFSVLGTAIAIYIVCSLIDFLREKLFGLLKIKKGLNRLEAKFLPNLWKDEGKTMSN